MEKPCGACGYDFKYEEASQTICNDCWTDYYVEQAKEMEESNG